nr:MAG TPA: hypothetical protein [Caudoviricetes sp.]DAZ82658.1 MAG TPA: hypothetical protein [Caudoviricetes sp.]
MYNCFKGQNWGIIFSVPPRKGDILPCFYRFQRL